METNKYYHPDISEFHVGFEYEFKGQTDWVKTTYGSFLPKHPEYYIKNKEWRVKHLDKEDIESLGFISELVEDGVVGFKRKSDIKARPYFYFLLNDTELNINICDVLFTIKNKSELKRLLVQLGIS